MSVRIGYLESTGCAGPSSLFPISGGNCVKGVGCSSCIGVLLEVDDNWLELSGTVGDSLKLLVPGGDWLGGPGVGGNWLELPCSSV